MATIINNPPNNQQAPAAVPAEGSGIAGMIVGIAVIAILLFLFMMYGLPAMRGNQAPPSNTQENRVMEEDRDSNPTINVPDKIEVDVNKK